MTKLSKTHGIRVKNASLDVERLKQSPSQIQLVPRHSGDDCWDLDGSLNIPFDIFFARHGETPESFFAAFIKQPGIVPIP